MSDENKDKKSDPFGNVNAGLSSAQNLDEIKRLVKAEQRETSKKKRLNAQIDAGLYDRFAEVTKARGHSISALVRVWIQDYISKNE